MKMAATFDSFSRKFTLALKGNLSHTIEVGSDPSGNITRINNALEGMGKQLEEAVAEQHGSVSYVDNAAEIRKASEPKVEYGSKISEPRAEYSVRKLEKTDRASTKPCMTSWRQRKARWQSNCPQSPQR